MTGRSALGLLALAALMGATDAAGAAEGAPPSPGAVSGPLRIWIRGAYGGGRPFEQARTFTEFAEAGRVDSRYEQGGGPGLEVAVGWRLGRRLALAAAGTALRRDETGTYTASLPHPLLFGAARRAEGTFTEATQRETAGHLSLAVLGTVGAVELQAFAGPSLVHVDADLLRSVDYTHAYPYDQVTVTGTTVARSSGSGAGFHVGAGFDWRVARHLALGTQGRFSRATVKLHPGPEETVDVTAGGLQVSAGLRLDF